MNFWLTLPHLKPPVLDHGHLTSSIGTLAELTKDLTMPPGPGVADPVTELRSRIQQAHLLGMEIKDVTVGIKRREFLLLSLYLFDLYSDDTRNSLPAFGRSLATLLLGAPRTPMKRHIRRQATLLYFAHFGEERLPCLEWLADRLQESWSSAGEHDLPDPASRSFHEHAATLFNKAAPASLAQYWQPGESADRLADRFHLPEQGLFRERLVEEVILSRLRSTSADQPDTALYNLVAEEKDRRLRTVRLGAEAVRILIRRSITEHHGWVPKPWRENLVTFACDPRLPNPGEQEKWWDCWASRSEKDVAIRALSEVTIEKFLELLADSLWDNPYSYQFEERKDFLLNLFKLGKIIEARLVAHEKIYHNMDPATRRIVMPSRATKNSEKTSFICLRCSGDVFLIEGTHNFGLRCFVGKDSFPVPGFWSSGPGTYTADRFKVSPRRCSIHQPHIGDWVSSFKWKLRARLSRNHIEW